MEAIGAKRGITEGRVHRVYGADLTRSDSWCLCRMPAIHDACFFLQVICHCGRTVLEPPIPCGTRINCVHQCMRDPPSCGHPRAPHSCHEDPSACPPCPFLTGKICACGKKVVDNVRCSQEKVSCGVVCGKWVSFVGCPLHTEVLTFKQASCMWFPPLRETMSRGYMRTLLFSLCEVSQTLVRIVQRTGSKVYCSQPTCYAVYLSTIPAPLLATHPLLVPSWNHVEQLSCSCVPATASAKRLHVRGVHQILPAANRRFSPSVITNALSRSGMRGWLRRWELTKRIAARPAPPYLATTWCRSLGRIPSC